MRVYSQLSRNLSALYLFAKLCFKYFVFLEGLHFLLSWILGYFGWCVFYFLLSYSMWIYLVIWYSQVNFNFLHFVKFRWKERRSLNCKIKSISHFFQFKICFDSIKFLEAHVFNSEYYHCLIFDPVKIQSLQVWKLSLRII